METYQFSSSTSGQNVLCFEIYPQAVKIDCPSFATKWAYCGLSHPETLAARQGVIVCNVSDRTIYIKNYLHRIVHAGLSVDLAHDYITELVGLGYSMKPPSEFDAEKRHLLIVGSDESVIIPQCLVFINENTPQFDESIEDLFKKCQLPNLGKSLLSNDNQEAINHQTAMTSRGQPALFNFGYALQNSTDSTTIPGLNVPKLTTKNVRGLVNVTTKEPLLFDVVLHMATVTEYLRENYQELQIDKPFPHTKRNETFGNRIVDIINHPNKELGRKNCFEFLTAGAKTQECNGFGSHIDVLNSWREKGYAYVVVMSQAIECPANPTIPFGNGRKYFPFYIFCNRLGCESCLQYDNNVERWLADVEEYISSQPSSLCNIQPNLLSVDSSNPDISVIIERDNEMYCHRKAHINKHVQLSSYCCTIRRANEELKWWTEVHLVEYLYFCGICCTPVTPWFMMKIIFDKYKNHPPSGCLFLVLCELALDIQGGVDRSSGHRYTSSSGKAYDLKYLCRSLWNLRDCLRQSNTSNDTAAIIKRMSKSPSDGGCYKLGNLSSTEVLVIYHLSGCGSNLLHAENAVINENNNTTKYLEKTYNFKKQQRSKLLNIAKQRMPHRSSMIVENGSCKMAINKSKTSVIPREDTVMADQPFIFHVVENTLSTIDQKGDVKAVEKIQFPRDFQTITERMHMHWYNMTAEEAASYKLVGQVTISRGKDDKFRVPTKVLYKNMGCNKQPDVVETKGCVVSKSQAKKRKSSDSIYVTKFAPKSIEYIKKRSGCEAREMRLKKTPKTRKKQLNNDTVDAFKYHSNKIETPDVIFPKFDDLWNPQAKKEVHFSNAVRSVLQMSKKEYQECLQYDYENIVQDDGKKVKYWSVVLEKKNLNLKISSYDDVEFCFSYNNAVTKAGDCGKWMYATKDLARVHLEIKVLLQFKPKVVKKWCGKGHAFVPKVIVPTVYSKSFRRNRSDPHKSNFDKKLELLEGWLCLFCSREKLYGIELDYMKFEWNGDHKGVDDVKDHLFCLA